MSVAVLPFQSSGLRTNFLHAAGSIVFNEMQRRKIARLVSQQVIIGGPAAPRADLRKPNGFGDDVATRARPDNLASLDAREFNRLLHYLRIQMAISRWGAPRPRDWFDRTGLHFKQKQRAATRQRLEALFRRVFS